MTTRAIAAALLATGWFAAGSARARAAEADHLPRLVSILRVIDQIPDRATLVGAGVGSDGAALLAIARDVSLDRYTRMRAAAGLAHFPAARAQDGLAALVRDAGADEEVRIQAVAAHTYARGADALPMLRTLAADPSEELRGAAVRNLARVGTAEAIALLRARAAPGIEPSADVRRLIADRLAKRPGVSGVPAGVP
jgi:HEAT repeat protein